MDPVHEEFFKAQDLADALVREAIQNSLDARRGRAAVRVRRRPTTSPSPHASRCRARVLTVPYFFTFVNAAAFAGILSMLKGKRTAAWSTRSPAAKPLDGPAESLAQRHPAGADRRGDAE